MSTENSFSNDAISASTPLSNYDKRKQWLEMINNKFEHMEEKKI